MSVQTEVVTDPTRRASRFARVVPLAFITYSLAYLDRVNWGYAEAGGMRDTLHIGPKEASATAAVFFIGYCLLQIPGTSYAAHRSARRIIFWALLLWGALSTATGLVKTVPALVTARIGLGVVEGVVYPSLLVFLTHWFTKPERSRANTLLILGNPLTVMWASAVSGYIIEYFNGHRIGHLTGWQMMFVVEGLPSIVWAVAWLALARDHPAQAGWLEPREAQAVQQLLDHEQRSIPPMENYLVAFTDTRVLLLCAQFLCWSVGIYGFVMWLPTIVKEGAQLGVGRSGLLSAIPYLISCVVMFTVATVSDRKLVRKPFVWPWLFLGAVGLYGSYLAGRGHFWLAFGGLILAGVCMYAPYGPFWAMVAEMVPRNVRGESMALVNTAGAVGGGIGIYFVGWLQGAWGNGPAFLFMAAALVLSGLFTLSVKTRPAAAFPVIPVQQYGTGR